VFITVVFFLFRVHAGKLGQVTDFTVMIGTAKPCVDQYMVLFRYSSLGDVAVIPGGLHDMLCHAFLVSIIRLIEPVLVLLRN